MPDPLVPQQTSLEEAESEKLPIIVGYGNSDNCFWLGLAY
jgi:hypothetical protein